MKRMLAFSVILLNMAPLLAFAQQVGSNAYIDMYFGDWRTSTPRMTHGSLEERAILTRGNAMKPTQKGAVLTYINGFSYATLAPGASTSATRLQGRQEVFYILSGRGIATAGADASNLLPNIAVLMPANLEFTMKNSGSEPLTMYLIDEPTPPGFRPNSKMVVKDENVIPIASTDRSWCHIVKMLYTEGDGLGTLRSISTVVLDPLTIGKPHITDYNDIEEVWASIEGTSLALVGPFLRRQSPGIAYLHPPDNLAPTTNINYSENEQVKFLVFCARPFPSRNVGMVEFRIHTYAQE